MKPITFKLVLPLTIIVFVSLSKWWYALPVDAPDTMFTGWPLPYMCNGWHTSLSLQIFVGELIIDFITYSALIFILAYFINRYVVTLKVSRVATVIMWVLSGCVILFSILILLNPDNIFRLYRPFKIEVISTGVKIGLNPVHKPE